MQQLSFESDLIAKGRNGDTAALSELFARHYRTSVGVARRILRSEDDALDAVQAAYLSAFRHFDSFRGETGFSAWMTSIVMNQCFGQLRGARRWLVYCDLESQGLSESPAPFVNPDPSPEEFASRRELAAALSAAASKLPRHLHDVYVLCCVHGFSVKEAAESLGLTVPAAKIRVFRAKHRVRAELQHKLAARGRVRRMKASYAQSPEIESGQVAA